MNFQNIYDKHCPIKKSLVKGKDSNKELSWMTKGLQKSCQKKKILYKQFLQLRTNESEHKYKLYKNKLTTIIRQQKKKFYSEKLESSKNNIQKTWEVINHIIRNKLTKTEFPNYFWNISGSKVEHLKTIVNNFNDYFVSVGPTLANKIIVDNQNKELFNGLIKWNLNSMFLCGIEEWDIIEVVNKFKNKTSIDVNFTDMCTLKEVIHSIVKPLTYICNLSKQASSHKT